ncbi:MAG: pentapeptide repeat-containing protein [Cellvibrionales bacterium]|nr:pentapeptide repeat-containing protein [Cellvibrionales bacterium]
MNATELQAVLAAHARWLANEPGGERANLSGANLTGANLTGATVWAGWKIVEA